jgi:hypothetical protein
MQIVTDIFFEMNSYVMILVKIGVIHRNLFGRTLFPLHPRASECFGQTPHKKMMPQRWVCRKKY